MTPISLAYRMEVNMDMGNLPAQRVSSNFCHNFVVRQVRFKPSNEEGPNVKQTRLKYNRSVFAGTQDQLTEICLKILIDSYECNEKVTTEWTEVERDQYKRKVTISHKIYILNGETPSKAMEIRCQT